MRRSSMRWVSSRVAERALVHPLASPWGRFHLYSFFIDAPQPAIIDTGIASSPSEGMAPALAALGRRIEDVRWILLTHGHIDHIGGAHALWEMTGRKAEVVIHESDADLLRRREAHVDLYCCVRHQYLQNRDGPAQQREAALAVVSGEMEPTMLLRGGESIDLGDGITVTAEHAPGHTAGSVAYVIDGQSAAFVGDACQVHGAANRFPGYEDPDAYRASLRMMQERIAPRRLYLGHPYRTTSGDPYGVELKEHEAAAAIQESLDVEARIRASARRHMPAGIVATDSPYSPFEAIATDLDYTNDPRLDPSPFFTTLHGYRSMFAPTA